ncbi:MAG TPA: hypothetical protein VJS38_08280 [Phenylobacterium sp.]|uniref:hypothetical protein n=1 Tax=Phenylobacterium sp. TaxID=1871053 RepID=UPI002B484058|nr:hypothetical protein [Phenylobacterium sp.]HKR88161.1 hypothetical protein [Phenylobacterium sp.]
MAGSEERTDSLEIASAIVLSVAALASSWASYQAGLWDGEQAAHYSRTNALRTEASRAILEGDALAGVEVQIFGAWLTAKTDGKERLAAFYEARFPPHFKPAFHRWQQDNPLSDPSAPPTPFATPAYHRPGLERSQTLERQADKEFRDGQYANAVSDGFQQGATMLALALFFGGIGQVFKGRTARVWLLAVASVSLVLGLLRLLSLPVQVLGLGIPG